MKITPEVIVLGGGCFWCVEAVYQQVIGVLSVEPGYAGGTVINPSYEQVCGGKTGHIEVAKITYDSALLSLNTLLAIFWKTHDPTSFDRQGNDVGSQYRSVIFYTTENQKKEAEKEKQAIVGAVTEIRPLEVFYPAEAYHRDYYERHKNEPYCQLVIAPKLRKLGL